MSQNRFFAGFSGELAKLVVQQAHFNNVHSPHSKKGFGEHPISLEKRGKTQEEHRTPITWDDYSEHDIDLGYGI